MPNPQVDTSDFLKGVLGTTAATWEPQRSNNAILYVTNVNFAPGLAWESTLKFALASFSLPKNETQPSMIPYLNEVRKFAGSTMFADINVTFHDYVERQVASMLWAWRYKIHDPRTGLRGLKADYARQGYIDQFAPDGTRACRYEIMNIWPGNIDCGEIDMASDEPIRIGVTFVCDKVYPTDDSGLAIPAPLI